MVRDVVYSKLGDHHIMIKAKTFVSLGATLGLQVVRIASICRATRRRKQRGGRGRGRVTVGERHGYLGREACIDDVQGVNNSDNEMDTDDNVEEVYIRITLGW